MKKSLWVFLVVLVIAFAIPIRAESALPWEMVLDQEIIVALDARTSHTWLIEGGSCIGGLYGSEIATSLPVPEGWQVTFVTGYSEEGKGYRYHNTIQTGNTYGWLAYTVASFPSPERVVYNRLMVIGYNATEPLNVIIYLRLHYCAPWWIPPLRTLRHEVVMPLVMNATP